MSFDYFGLGLEEAYGFGISLIEELDDGFFWRVQTDYGEACLKRFRRAIDVENSTRASQYVHERGFTRTPKVIPTAEGRPYIRSPMTDPLWYLALFEWVSGQGDEPAPTLWKWHDQDHEGSDVYKEVATDLALALATFHDAGRGFKAWPSDREADFWIWSSRRIRTQTELVKKRLSTEERPAIRQLVEEALGNCEPFLDECIRKAESSEGLFRSVVARSRERQDVRHCDLHLGNFLVGRDGLMIIDLAELEPSPRIYKDTGCLSSFRDDETVALALTTYSTKARLSKDEIELFPIINDPIDSWRRFMDGYLSGDWTEEMMTNYDGNIRNYRKRKERLDHVATVLRNHLN